MEDEYQEVLLALEETLTSIQDQLKGEVGYVGTMANFIPPLYWEQLGKISDKLGFEANKICLACTR